MRIIAGQFRGRRLVAPKGLATRPTTDRVREAWFSILHRIEGRVLDLYAGTGALGFEALSRGAELAVFVEVARPAREAIAENAAKLGVSDRTLILSTKVEQARGAIERNGPYHLIVTDPPWTALESADRALRALLRPELLVPGGRLVLGYPQGRELDLDPTAGWKLDSRRRWGDSAAAFFSRESDSSPAPEDELEVPRRG